MRKKRRSIAENEQVKELIALLKENKSPDYKEFMEMINQVSEMEKHLDEALTELKTMREELQNVQNRPLKSLLQRSHKTMESNISELNQKLSKLKDWIIKGCQNILSDFKNRGTVALNGVTQFVHLRPALDAIRRTAENSIQASDRAIARIDVFSAEFHKAGKHLRNMGRTLQGKEPASDVKENGRIAGAFKTVIRAERSCISAIKQKSESSLGNLDRLEQAVQRRPSVLKAMKEQIPQVQSEKAKQTQTKTQDSR